MTNAYADIFVNFTAFDLPFAKGPINIAKGG